VRSELLTLFSVFTFGFLLLASPASANDCTTSLVILGNPVLRFPERERILEMSSRELFTHAIGRVQPGKNPILNKAIADAEAAGVEVIAIESQALLSTPEVEAFAERMNGNGAFFLDMDGKPTLALGKNISEELAVHEIRHLNDFLKTTGQWEREGMTRDDARIRYREAQMTTSLTYALERNAIIEQLKFRYRGTGFRLDDPNLIERVIYPEMSVLISKGVLMGGDDEHFTASGTMDKAIWKALMIQRQRYNRLQTEIAAEKDPGRRAALVERANALKSARTLFDAMFPHGSLDEGQMWLVQSLFGSRALAQLERLKTLRQNTFTIDRE